MDRPRWMKRRRTLAATAAAAWAAATLVVAVGCITVVPDPPDSDPTATPVASATETAIAPASGSPTPSPTAEPTATETVEPGATSTPEATPTPTATEPPVPSEIVFRAVYDRVVDSNDLGGGLQVSAMSGDGSRLAFHGRREEDNSPAAYTVAADGSDLQAVSLPAGITSLSGVSLSGNGARAFFCAPDQRMVIEAAGGSATTIPVGLRCQRPAATADGAFVYFWDGGRGVWRLAHGGVEPEQVVRAEDVPRDGGTASGLGEFAVSDDGGVVAFIIPAYRDGADVQHQKPELFALVGGEYRQLTNGESEATKDNVAVSGDGSTIVFRAAAPENKWYSVASDGTRLRALADADFGAVPPALTGDGSRVFYVDNGANGGSLLNTDGTGRQDLLPAWKARSLRIAASGNVAISDDGRRVSFLYQYAVAPEKYGLYVGHLDADVGLADGPVIESIGFVPGRLAIGDPDARVAMVAHVGDAQGMRDVMAVGIDQLVDGKLETDASLLPAFFDEPRNDGQAPDATADDAFFTAEGYPGATAGEPGQVLIRVSAMDASGTVTVADAFLIVGE